ncbi:MAG: YfhO family protein [bacterium]|nr:YfhO family protein [bacterium]
MSLSIGLIAHNLSPIIWIFSIFGSYNLQTMLAEVLFIQLAGFFGMYLWLKTYCNKWISLYGAFFFSISAPILSTLHNFSVPETISLIPWVAFALKRTLMGSHRSLALLSTLLWVLFTTGYLGTNLMYLPFIFAFCIVESIQNLISEGRRDKLMRFLHGMLRVALSFALFLALSSLQWLEAWNFTHLNYHIFRGKDTFSVYNGASSLKAISTLLFVNNFPAYIPRTAILPAGGVSAIIYIGLFNLCLILYAFIRKSNLKINLLILFLAATAFIFSLSESNLLTKFAVSINPILQVTRFHAWHSGIIIFFLFMLACRGLQSLTSTINRQELLKLLLCELLVLLLVCFTILALWTKNGSYCPCFFQSQIINIILLILSTIFVLKVLQTIALQNKILSLLTCLPLINLYLKKSKLTTQIYKNKWIYLTPLIVIAYLDFIPNALNYLSWPVGKSPALLYEQAKNYGFSVQENTRKETVHRLFTKIPDDWGYREVVDLKIFKLWNSVSLTHYKRLSRYIFYFPGNDGLPDETKNANIGIETLDPSKVKLKIISQENNQRVIWSSPYTPFWKLFINGKKATTQEEKTGFTSFIVGRGTNTVLLVYAPNYFLPYLFVLGGALGVVVFLVLPKVPKKIK